jgi:hypothetical protein
MLSLAAAVLLAASPPYDLSSAEKVDAAAAAAANLQGKVCRKEISALKVLIIGSFLSDRGCRWVGYFLGGQYIGSLDKSGPALRAAGWASVEKRDGLAVLWAEQALELEDPRVLSHPKGGGVVIAGSITEPVGMREAKVRPVHHVKITFTESGDTA